MTFLSQSCWAVGVTWKTVVCHKQAIWIVHEEKRKKAKGW